MANETSRTSNQVILGLVVVAVGVLFLLDNLDIIALRHVVFFWPLAFIGSGLVVLLGDGPRNGRNAGLILIAIGVLMMLNRLGFGYVSLHTLWPLVLIGLGGLILYRTVGGGRRAGVRLDKDAMDAENTVDINAILGGFQRRVSAPDFRGGEITAIMGGCELDLRGAEIVKEAVINVCVIWGGISIKVPPDWTVILHGTPVMGGFAEKTARPPDNSKRLVVTGYAIMGGVDVRN